MKKFILVFSFIFFSFLFFNVSSVLAATLYYNAAIDSDWSTLGNWWQDMGFTVPAVGLPTASDDVIIEGNVVLDSSGDASVKTMVVNDPYYIKIDIVVAEGAVFNGSSYSDGINTITGNVVFNDSSYNDGGAVVLGNAVFNDSSRNSGNVSEDATFNGSSWNSGNVSEDATFNGQSRNDGTVSGNAIFNDTSRNFCNGVVSGDAIFNNSSWNGRGDIFPFPVCFLPSNIIMGEATFNDLSRNTPQSRISGNAVFNDSSYNGTSTRILSNATFNHSAANNGTVVFDAFFYFTTINRGSVEGNACFAPTADRDGGTVLGLDTVCSISLPSVTTLSASSVTKTEATLNGETTDAGGSYADERGFEYGISTSYGTTVSETSGPYDVGTFTANISGLSCGKTYHYRAYAINSEGIGYGEDTTFKTTDCPSGSYVQIAISSGHRNCEEGELFNPATGLPCADNEQTTTTTTTIAATSSNTPNCSLSSGLAFGSIGDEVKCLQTGLNTKILSNLVLDGMFGPLTKAAVIKFQLANNLVGDGIVGPLTRGVLNQ